LLLLLFYRSHAPRGNDNYQSLRMLCAEREDDNARRGSNNAQCRDDNLSNPECG